MMLATVVWFAYLLIAYGILPTVYRFRFGRWPFTYSFGRFDGYTIIDFAFGLAIIVFTAALLFGPNVAPLSPFAGCALIAAAIALQVWAVGSMGVAWRFGQDARDQTTAHIRHGPFRFVRHPIYLSLVGVACGEGLLIGVDWRSALLVLASVAHGIIQGRLETKHWSDRSPGL